MARGWPGVWLLALAWLAWMALSGFADPLPLRGNLGIHDPSTIVKCKDRYYVFGSGRGIISKWSTNTLFWTAGPRVFSSAPVWTTNAVPEFDGNIWAPDLHYFNGRYCLYYSISSWGKQVSAIGLVTNPTLDPTDPGYLWTDHGIVIRSTNGSPYNTIDPNVTVDAAGNPWLCFGSYWTGIYVVQLDPVTGLRLTPDSPVTRLAYNSSIEAACIFRRGGYYYLFVNWGSCCVGVNSTYNVRVGRATSVTGPFRDRNGVDLASNGGTRFLEGTGKFPGPGHIGVLSEGGDQWISYHYYDAGAYAPGYGAYGLATLGLEPLAWSADGWPTLTHDWSAVYPFQADARDEGGQYYGLLVGGASVTNDSIRGRVLNLTGTNQYVRLPAGVAFARTFSAVVKWNGGDAWQRVFDFGTDTSSYVMLTPSSGNGRLRCDIRADGVTQTVEAPGGLTPGAWTHVALTFDGQRGVLLVNGRGVATNNNLTLSPLNVRAQTNHLGRSKFAADADFNGQISSFRAHGRALTAAEIAAPKVQLTQPAAGAAYWPGSTIAFEGGATDLLDVPLPASALSWRIEHAVDDRTNLVFGPVAGVMSGVFAVPTNAPPRGSYRVLLTATDGSARTHTVSANVPPANPSDPPPSYYPLRADALDVFGRFDGALHGGAAFQTDPDRGQVLSLGGSGQYLSLPAGTARMMTLMAWVKWNGGVAGQRLFDFGRDTNSYAMLTPFGASGRLRFAISVNGPAGEQAVEAPGPLPAGVWTHVTVTLDGNTVILHTNGVPVASNAFANLTPANLGATNCWLGRSQRGDAYFNGQLGALRFVPRPLTGVEILAPLAAVAEPAHGSTYRPGDTIRFSGWATDFHDFHVAATGLTWTVEWRNGATVATVFGPATGLANGVFLVPTTGLPATNGHYRVRLVATDPAGRKGTNTVDVFPVSATLASADWASFYAFAIGGQDASNRHPATLLGGASIVQDPARGPVLNLSGAGQYASLPTGAGQALTISAWVKWNGGNPWQRVFDFGRDTTRWLFLTPRTSDGWLQCALTPNRSAYVQVIESTNPLPVGVWTHLAVVLDGRQGVLYLNGQAVAVNHSVNLLPADVIGNNCWLGRSQYAVDPYFNGRLDSLRLNSRALALQEILAPAPVITQPGPGALFAGGEALPFAGTATDYTDAPLPPSAFTWRTG